MKFLQIIVVVFILIVGVVGCGLFALLEQIGSSGGHTTQTSTLFTGIGLIAFLVWFVPIFLAIAVGVFFIKIVFFD